MNLKGNNKKTKAEKVAEGMAANIAANMKNPAYFADKTQMEDEVRKKIIEKRKKRVANKEKQLEK